MEGDRQLKVSLPQSHERIVRKNGNVNLTKENVGFVKKRFFDDLFTALLDAKWSYTLLLFACNYLITWTIFASIWYLMSYLNGDLDYYRDWLDAEDKDLFETQSGHTPCVKNMYNFISAILYSIETQNAVGYGFRVLTEECGAPILLVVQLLCMHLIQALTVGVIISKLARPKKRAQNIRFSRNAVICRRDGEPYLMFRVADTQSSYIINSLVRARIVRKRLTAEGELVEFHQEDLTLQIDSCDNRVVMLWPTLVLHKIDVNSPFYELSAHTLPRELFEIVVFIDGGVESTGLAAQARTSYMPSEILWGHRFQSIVRDDTKVNFDFFDSTYSVDMPECSARDANERNSETCQSVGDGNKEIENLTLRRVGNGDSNFSK